MTKFASIQSKKPSDACSDCEGYCEKACPHGIETRLLLAVAQQNMELSSNKFA